MKYIPLFLLFVLSLGLLLFACTSKKSVVNKTNEQGQISVLLDKKSSSEQLSSQFTQYGLKPLGLSSKSENRWICAYNSSTISAKRLAAELMKTDFVIEAKPIYGDQVGAQSGTSGKGKKVKINSGN